jgi:hypothetical protein
MDEEYVNEDVDNTPPSASSSAPKRGRAATPKPKSTKPTSAPSTSRADLTKRCGLSPEELVELSTRAKRVASCGAGSVAAIEAMQERRREEGSSFQVMMMQQSELRQKELALQPEEAARRDEERREENRCRDEERREENRRRDEERAEQRRRE